MEAVSDYFNVQTHRLRCGTSLVGKPVLYVALRVLSSSKSSQVVDKAFDWWATVGSDI